MWDQHAYLHSSTHSHLNFVYTSLSSARYTQNIPMHDSECWSTIQFSLWFSWSWGLFLHMHCSDQKKSKSTHCFVDEKAGSDLFTPLYDTCSKGSLFSKAILHPFMEKKEKKNKSKAIGKLHLWCMRISVKFSSTERGQCYKSNYQGHCLMIKLVCKLLRS